jgi:hypothetical protein
MDASSELFKYSLEEMPETDSARAKTSVAGRDCSFSHIYIERDVNN